MKYLRIIAIVFALILASACIDNLECPMPNVNNSNDIIIMGRTTRFDDYNVDTRSAKDDSEALITSYAMAIFPIENKMVGNCVFYEKKYGNQLLFNLDRSLVNYTTNGYYAIYIFANMPELTQESYDGTGKSLSEMLKKTIDLSATQLKRPEKGFPMIGSIGDYVSEDIEEDDKKYFVISPTPETNQDGTIEDAPLLGKEQDPQKMQRVSTLNIPMKALFAKMNFEIEVRPDQIIEGGFIPQFQLKSCELVNVPKYVDFKKNVINLKSEYNAAEWQSSLSVAEASGVASGANKIKFSFYLPENLLTPAVNASDYEYPFGKGTDIRDEDQKYRQRYKVKLLDDPQDRENKNLHKQATHIVLNGEFKDHQSHAVEVTYTIYLGKDNYSNFDITRNGEYNNYITIRGVLNSKPSSDEDPDNEDPEDYISIDHRVNVNHKEPTIISLRREVLLDSHFEIRPLRVKYNSDFEGADAKYVKVEVVNPGTTTWMRLERSSGVGSDYAGKTNSKGESIYITEEGASKGKRRYFTTDLVSGGTNAAANYSLVNSTSVTVPIPTQYGDDQCVWIYVDECTEVGDAVRSGIIRVTYLDADKETIENNEKYPQIDYTINQRKLFQVKYNEDNNNTIVRNIEYHEEYLHNFDSDETFGQTHYEGMVWGLEGLKLSYKHPALFFKAKTGDWANGIIQYFMGEVPAYYDFYIKKHDETKMADPKQVELHEYDGYHFCDEIINVVNGVNGSDTNDANDIKALSLDKQPKSAVEYCYNKNKRTLDGEVENSLWYLPSIDEIEAIVMSKYGDNNEYNTYARFIDFQDKFYWSSQPAYIQNYAHLRWTLFILTLDYWGTFYYEDIGNTQYDINNDTDRKNVGSARATKVKYVNNEYQTAKSGTNGYYSYYEAEDKQYKFEGTYNGVTVGTISREEGNKARNAMARVRCVRKMD